MQSLPKLEGTQYRKGLCLWDCPVRFPQFRTAGFPSLRSPTHLHTAHPLGLYLPPQPIRLSWGLVSIGHEEVMGVGGWELRIPSVELKNKKYISFVKIVIHLVELKITDKILFFRDIDSMFKIRTSWADGSRTFIDRRLFSSLFDFQEFDFRKSTFTEYNLSNLVAPKRRIMV